MKTSMAILISGILIALVIATKSFTPRYSIVASTEGLRVFARLDNKTGKVCQVYLSSSSRCRVMK